MGIDPATVERDIMLAGMVETIQGRVPVVELKEHRWSCDVTKVSDSTDMCEVKLYVEDAKFSVRPCLFIAVVDCSGSMSGNPYKQVLTALRHIYHLSQHNSSVKLMMISYESSAKIINTPEEYKICGGTNFRAAFEAVNQLLSRYICSDENKHAVNNVSSVTIAFLTDGQDQSYNRERLVPEFREMLRRRWGDNPLSVHTIGFSRNCDRDLLEGMRESGNIPGTFRYAEPGENDDELCNKLTGVFNIGSQSSTVPIRLTINGERQDIRLPVDSEKYGCHSFWKKFDSPPHITVSSQHDNDTVVPVKFHSPSEVVLERWLAKLTDQLASTVLEFSNGSFTPNIKELWCALTNQKIETLMDITTESSLTERLTFLSQQVSALSNGELINVGKLSDLRFGSMFSDQVPPLPQVQTVCPQPSKPKLTQEAYNEQHLPRYNRNNKDSGRNDLQKAITSLECNKVPDNLKALIQNATMDDMMHVDHDGNNTLHLTAYCGHSEVIRELIKRFPDLPLDTPNRQGETAVTIAIKKRGFHFTLGFLLDAGATLPRRKSLQRFAVENDYTITAEIISGMGETSTTVDHSMKLSYVKFTYQRAMKSGKEINPEQYLDVFLAKGDKDMAEKMIVEHNAQATVDMLNDYCIPKKADDPETDRYLELAKLLLYHFPHLIHEKKKPDMETPLLTASNRGSRPHVRYFLSLGAKVDEPNEKLNTPLWIATFKRYPCIIDELLDAGADIERANEKGNRPIYGICERGSVKIAEKLISRGADITYKNINGDTTILLCTRNGQHETLQFLLNYVDEEFVNFKAHIDGFNAIMASAEQDRPECMRVLFEYGIDLNQKTDSNNEIIADATPLHIAAYYGREEATKMLIKLGADLNVTDAHGQTPLHTAVIQGHIGVIKSLRRAGIDQTVVDKYGNRAQAYCRNRKDIRRVLVDPALDIIMKLSKGGFDREENVIACQLLRDHTGVEGCCTPASAIDILGDDGTTPLTQAVIHSNFDVVQTMVDLGANICQAQFWASVVNNPRIIKIVGKSDTDLSLIRRYSNILFLGRPPKYTPSRTNTIGVRMSDLANAVVYNEDYAQIWSNLIMHKEQPRFRCDYLELDEQTVWDARVHLISVFGKQDSLKHLIDPSQAMAITLFTNNVIVPRSINGVLLGTELITEEVKEYTKHLFSALQSLPPYVGEVFMGVDKVDRRLFEIGQEFCWPRFVSCSTLWRVATENCPSFTTKAKKGTIFAIRSKTGRFVGQYSQFGFDAEVLFLPRTKFRVNNWYRGDVFALGQPNIREHTFSLEDEDIERLRHSERAMIIELVEI